MFLNYIKDFFALKLIKKSLSNVKISETESKVKTVGILFDETYFNEKEALVESLISYGIQADKVFTLVYKDIIKKKRNL